ncbi:SDR family NAD(P)-dependent oxidoreductase [Acinetobacter ursingii]|uniref:SDR family NAD(P)-dependent oxidoreductase n=1 Tax=Acinetobacter ursingii TaxID=108980 RepID=UPI003AF43F37
MTTPSKVLITGASSGIGAVYADRFAQRGYHLILVARDLQRLNSLAEQLIQTYQVGVEVIQADLTQDQDISRVEQILQQDTDIEILVNNAGMSLNGAFSQQDLKNIEQLLTLNIMAVVRLCHAISQQFIQKKSGAIINLGSVVGLAPEFGLTLYGASKAFIQYFSQALSLELQDKGVYIQAVLPSATKTEIWERSGSDLKTLPPMMEVSDLVDAALVGFDHKENITIPVLQDENQWKDYQQLRMKLLPEFSTAKVATRYKVL